MKKLLLILTLFLLSTTAQALDPCMTGSWYDPEQSGFGVNIEAHDVYTASYLYTFDGDSRPVWYVMLGDKILTMSVAYVLDDDDFITKEVEVGVAEIIPITDGVIRFRYSLIAEVDPDGGGVRICRGDHCDGDYIFKQLTRPLECEK